MHGVVGEHQGNAAARHAADRPLTTRPPPPAAARNEVLDVIMQTLQVNLRCIDSGSLCVRLPHPGASLTTSRLRACCRSEPYLCVSILQQLNMIGALQPKFEAKGVRDCRARCRV